MFGFETVNKKSLIIVCDEPELIYANYLIQLIGQKDDVGDEIVGVADDSVEAAIYTVKQYKDSMSKISSNQRVIFIGAIAMEQAQTMDKLFDAWGMMACGLGKRWSLFAYDAPRKAYKKKALRDAYHDFRQYSEEEYGLSQVNALEEYERDLKEINPNGIPFEHHLMVRNSAMQEMLDQRYKLLVKKTYIDALKSFMED